MAGSIGIKEANGDFFSIFEENSIVKKRLVLTTVHDNQKSVQIDLYRSLKKSMADAAYIGSIVVENISPKSKGEPSIEMTISSTQDGSVSVFAVDLNNPSNEHHLSVSLKSLEEDQNDYPDFDIESQSSQGRTVEPGRHERKFPWLVIIIIGLILALLCLGLWFFLFRNKNPGSEKSAQAKPAAIEQTQTQTEKPIQTASHPAPAAEVQQSQGSPPVPAPQAEKKKPVVVEKPPMANLQAPARVRKPAPVFSFAVPETIPPEGIAYTIRWGDTLWDVSEAFYRNPRLYTYIVRTNGIRNPSLVASGTELTILPRE